MRPEVIREEPNVPPFNTTGHELIFTLPEGLNLSSPALTVSPAEKVWLAACNVCTFVPDFTTVSAEVPFLKLAEVEYEVVPSIVKVLAEPPLLVSVPPTVAPLLIPERL